MVLSGNSVDHLVISLAAMTAGVPVVPVSTAYSLLSADHGRIREIAALVRPGAVFAEDTGQFSAALDAAGDLPVIGSRGDRDASVLADLLRPARPGGRGRFRRDPARLGGEDLVHLWLHRARRRA